MFSGDCLFNKKYMQQSTLATTLPLSAANKIVTTAVKNYVLMAVWITCWVFLVCLLNPVLPEAIYRVDPLALLAATLRTYQRAACDSEQIMLSCPRGTSISIELAQYGRAGDLGDHTLCHPTINDNSTINSNKFRTFSGTQIEIKPAETCAISALQYTLLQSVVGACQKKRQCKFSGNATILNSGDPCFSIQKFIEIAYKCRPYEFRSKVACEDDSLVLICNPYSRIAIYSASFGHIDRDSLQCERNNTEVSEQVCLVTYATETVMQICHGRRRCNLAADAGTFGRPCKMNVRMHLKVVYTCLPRKVLKERYETASESDEPQSDLELSQEELYDENQFYKESETIPPKVQGAIPNNINGDADIFSQYHLTSTFMTPLLNYNDSTLEDGKKWLESRVNNNFTESNYQDTTIRATIFDSENEEENLKKTDSNISYRRRCQMKDDWGPIGLNCTDYDMSIERVDVYGFISNWMQAYVTIKQNQEELYLYLVISVAAGVLICLILVIGRLTLLRENTCCSSVDSEIGDKNAEMTNCRSNRIKKKNLPHNYEENISDIDNEIDLSATITPAAVYNYNSKDKQEKSATCLTSAAAPLSCTHNRLPQPPSENTTNLSADTNAVLVSHLGGLMMQRRGEMSSVNSMGDHLLLPPPMYSNSDSACSSTISGAIAMEPRLLAHSPLSELPIAHHNDTNSTFSSYLSGQHLYHNQHAHLGTLRQVMPGIPSASHVYYDNTTIPRNLVSRPTLLDSPQSTYGIYG